jgi:hydrogenase maturation protease
VSDAESILVIGYGNTLRRDDAAGPRVADEIARRSLPGVHALALHQLLPELAQPLSRARLAIFVDASVEVSATEARPISPDASPPTLHHTGGPSWLLALARSAYDRCPPAWLVTVPAPDLGFGEGLSPEAQLGTEQALDVIERLLIHTPFPVAVTTLGNSTASE